LTPSLRPIGGALTAAKGRVDEEICGQITPADPTQAGSVSLPRLKAMQASLSQPLLVPEAFSPDAARSSDLAAIRLD